jgi:hypothetical protein
MRARAFEVLTTLAKALYDAHSFIYAQRAEDRAKQPLAKRRRRTSGR